MVVIDHRSFPPLQVDVQRLRGDIAAGKQLLELLSARPEQVSVWSGPGLDVVGLGCAWRRSFGGANQAAQAAREWARISEGAVLSTAARRSLCVGDVGDQVVPARPPLAFGSFGFSPRDRGVLLAPALVIVRYRDVALAVTQSPQGRHILSTLRLSPAVLMNALAPGPGAARVLRGRLSQAQWMERVRVLARLLRAGKAQKVVLARDVQVQCVKRVHAGWLAAVLASSYPSCWVYGVDGLVGATPEMLAAGSPGRIGARVLAGTAGPDDGPILAKSDKDLREHALAVESVRRSLKPLARSLDIPGSPFVLRLPNVTHLATDVYADAPGLTPLTAAGVLHPTAAVCGLPSPVAARLIEHFEGATRGRYAAPVGWMDGIGTGQWGIALRCGQINAADPTRVRVQAGCGIMPDSNPERELAETRQKMRPVLDALGAR